MKEVLSKEKVKSFFLYDKKEISYFNEMIFGYNDGDIFDKIFAFLLALTPILQHYIGIIGNAGITVVVIALLYFSVRGLFKRNPINIAL